MKRATAYVTATPKDKPDIEQRVITYYNSASGILAGTSTGIVIVTL